MNPKISFIVPVYNAKKYLSDCLNSLLMQSFKDFEILLVDDGSTDESPKICDAYSEANSCIKVIHKKNGGPSSARNLGLLSAKGEYIWFVDSDDFLENNGAQAANDAIELYCADVFQLGKTLCDMDGKKMQATVPTFPMDNLLEHETICKYFDTMATDGMSLYTWRFLFRRQMLVDNKMIFDESVSYGEDTLFNMQALLSAKTMTAINDCSYCYRLHENSLMRKKYKPDYDIKMNYLWKEKIAVYERLCENPSTEFYEDFSKYTLNAIFPSVISNIFVNDVSNKYELLKRHLKSEMIACSLKNFDISSTKSKSADWLVLNFARHKQYLIAYLICKYIWFK